MPSVPPANTTVHRFTGRWDKQYDTTTGDILMGARPYDPTTGRFLSVDPIPGGSLNSYDYAGQDPINNYDLAGTIEEGGNQFLGVGGYDPEEAGGGEKVPGETKIGRLTLRQLRSRLSINRDIGVVRGGPRAIQRLFRDLVRGATEDPRPGYPGRSFVLPNGIRVGLRTSDRYGLTIDLNGVPGLPPSFRIHYKS